MSDWVDVAPFLGCGAYISGILTTKYSFGPWPAFFLAALITGAIAAFIGRFMFKLHGLILAGVTPLKSARMADYMASNVAGMDIPESVLKRMGGVPKEKVREEGLKICLETISELRQTDGVRGVWRRKSAGSGGKEAGHRAHSRGGGTRPPSRRSGAHTADRDY